MKKSAGSEIRTSNLVISRLERYTVSHARSSLAYVYRGLYTSSFEFSQVDFLEIGWEARLTALADRYTSDLFHVL